jgi:hypothetical protein
MNTQELATRLVTLCRKGDFETAQKELFADDAVSIEPQATPAFPKETKGLKAIIEKGHTFSSMVQEMHAVELSDPIVAANAFACTLRIDATMKGKPRGEMAEVCVYETKGGKIISESFYL